MNVTILTVGSRGDFQPYLALGKGLKAAGYDVCLATHAAFEPIILNQGLDFFDLGTNPQALLHGAEGQQLMESGGNPLMALPRLFNLVEPILADCLERCWAACQTADVIISSGTAFWGYDLAKVLNRPHFFAPLQPVVPTGAFPNPMSPPWLSLQGPINRWTHQLLVRFYWQLFKGPINHWRVQTLGQAPHPSCPFTTHDWQAMPKLLGYSPTVIPKPKDWQADCHVTGYWFLDAAPTFQPPAELVDFLAAGEPPVVIGFGSMTTRNPERMTDIALGALDQSQQRGILLSGWGGISNRDLPDRVLKLETAPHDWLYPKMKAIVHHGGAGTTAAALRSGVPAVVVPFFGDQMFWSDRAFKLGTSPKPIPQKQLTAERLAQSIHQACSDRGLRQRSVQVGAAIRAEDGVGQAVQWINLYL